MAIWVIKYLERAKQIINPWCHPTVEALLIPSSLMEDAALLRGFKAEGFVSQ